MSDWELGKKIGNVLLFVLLGSCSILVLVIFWKLIIKALAEP